MGPHPKTPGMQPATLIGVPKQRCLFPAICEHELSEAHNVARVYDSPETSVILLQQQPDCGKSLRALLCRHSATLPRTSAADLPNYNRRVALVRSIG